MRNTTARRGLPLTAGRGLVTLLAVVPLVLSGFTIGYGMGSVREGDGEAVPAWERNGLDAHAPSAASFTATALEGPAPAQPAVLPVGTSEALGITVTHLQFVVDESDVGPGHTAELRLPVMIPPEGREVMLEVSSVRPVDCLCALSADTAPPYGRVWDAVTADSTTTEVTFDLTGAIDAPGRFGFAVTTPGRDAYLEFEGVGGGNEGPMLLTRPAPSPSPEPGAGPEPDPPAVTPEAGQAETTYGTCETDEKLVPDCGVLNGAAAGAHTNRPKEEAFLDFERTVGGTQHIYHAYERGDRRLFPTPEQIELATDPANPRTLFINWKPRMATWAEIAAGDPEVDRFLTRLAEHIRQNFDQPFFLTIHHEPENDVVNRAGSGMEPRDYREMFRYVVEFLRSSGVDNIVTVMNYMGYLKWTEVPWHDELYPGDDVVDWIGVSGYGQSLSDDGHSDFSEIVDQTKDGSAWPGYYHWVGQQHPSKPFMLAEWGVFENADYPDHQRTVFRSAAEQFAYYPRLKAIVYFSSPDAEGRDSEVDSDPEALEAYRDLMASELFEVRLRLGPRVPPVRRDVPVPGDPEPPWRLRGPGDAGPRSRPDLHRARTGGDGADHVGAVVGPVPAHRPRQPRRAPGQIPEVRPLPAPLPRGLDAGHDLPGAQQHRRPVSLGAARQIGAEVHPIGEIDVQVPGRTEHGPGPRPRAPVGMRGRIVLPIGLDLGQPHRHASSGDQATQQLGSHLDRIALEERPVGHEQPDGASPAAGTFSPTTGESALSTSSAW